MKYLIKYKDGITNVAGIIIAGGGTFLTVIQTGVFSVENGIKVGIGIAISVSAAVIGFFTGKVPTANIPAAPVSDTSRGDAEND